MGRAEAGGRGFAHNIFFETGVLSVETLAASRRVVKLLDTTAKPYDQEEAQGWRRFVVAKESLRALKGKGVNHICFKCYGQRFKVRLNHRGREGRAGGPTPNKRYVYVALTKPIDPKGYGVRYSKLNANRPKRVRCTSTVRQAQCQSTQRGTLKQLRPRTSITTQKDALKQLGPHSSKSCSTDFISASSEPTALPEPVAEFATAGSEGAAAG